MQPDDGNRNEIIDGEVFVTPAPYLSHQQSLPAPSDTAAS